MNEASNFSFEACRREGGGCQAVYGSTNADIDKWGADREAQGDSVVFFYECRDLCNTANRSVSSIENGVTGVTVTGVFPNGKEVTNVAAIAIKNSEGLSKFRLIDPTTRSIHDK